MVFVELGTSTTSVSVDGSHLCPTSFCFGQSNSASPLSEPTFIYTRCDLKLQHLAKTCMMTSYVHSVPFKNVFQTLFSFF